MKIRESRVLQRLRAGEVATCFKLNFSDARVAEVAAMHGFDCLWLDMEHTAATWADIEGQIRAAKLSDVDAMVRVARGGYSDYIKPLELDAAGIMVPHVMGIEDARNVVRMTRFHPVGRRPVDGGNADGAYCNIPFADYVKGMNDRRFLVVQIEDPEPLDELDEIATLEGIDMLFFGPADFSHGIGAPGDWDNPAISETRRRVAEAARDHGKFAGTTGTLETVPDLIAMGYRFISIGADVIAMNDYCSRLTAELRDLCRIG